MNPLTWILISFPFYLLVNGRLSTYAAALRSDKGEK